MCSRRVFLRDNGYPHKLSHGPVCLAFRSVGFFSGGGNVMCGEKHMASSLLTEGCRPQSKMIPLSLRERYPVLYKNDHSQAENGVSDRNRQRRCGCSGVVEQAPPNSDKSLPVHLEEMTIWRLPCTGSPTMNLLPEFSLAPRELS